MHDFLNMEKETLIQILTEQRRNILKKNIGVERNILHEIERQLKFPQVLVISGIRRCGKSTLLRQIINKYYQDTNFYYITFEDERFFNFNATDFNQIYETLIELFGEHKTFFIDEIQNIANFENFVRRFYENDFKFIITGSNSKLLSRELGSKLTARYINIKLNSFDFSEFLKFQNFNFQKEDLYISERKALIKRLFSEFLAKGGMPEYLIFNDEMFITRTYDDIIIKDIAVRHNIENLTSMRELYRYLISNFSNRYSYNSLQKIIDLGSVHTIKKFVGYLSDSFLISEVSKFDFSIKKQIVNEKKIYVSDIGFINRISMRYTKDIGRLLENLVFTILIVNFDVHYFHSSGECDFICSQDNQLLFAIQVCTELNEQNEKREISGLLNAAKILNIKKLFILTSDTEKSIEIEEHVISIIPVWKWFLNK